MSKFLFPSNFLDQKENLYFLDMNILPFFIKNAWQICCCQRDSPTCKVYTCCSILLSHGTMKDHQNFTSLDPPVFETYQYRLRELQWL